VEINYKMKCEGELWALEERCRTHDGHTSDRIRGTLHDVTVNFARCFIRMRGLVLRLRTPRLWTSESAPEMKLSLSRSSVLTALAIVVVLAAMPSAIARLVQTRDPYLLTQRFFEDMLARLSGAGRFRFILQPMAALIVGMRDGIKDSRVGCPPFLAALVSHRARRADLLRSAFASVRDLVAIAIILDVISQFLIFREVHPGAALVLGPVLIAVPYSISRAVANRIARRRSQQTSVIRPS
jgi:hypothetical protein